jgi:ligand-binding SRPBCC domain-containing protein
MNGKIHSIKNVQKISITLEQAWEFFSNPANLQAITPNNMRFKILSGDNGATVQKGQILEYKVSPVLGIGLYWKSEITEVQSPTYFADLQLKGPYAYWNHRHYFKAIEGGVEMTDMIEYKNPVWVLGDLANILFIKRKLRQLFEFRYKKMEELFGKWPGGVISLEIR